MVSITDDGQNASVYIHVPFCRKKCSYCHFYVILDDVEKRRALVTALKAEWRRCRPLLEGKVLTSLYFGGGTPILLGGAEIGDLVATIAGSVPVAGDCEITVEANPEEITAAGVRHLVAGGVNRLSIGLQTHDDAILHTLGRLHTGTSALAAIDTAAAAGITTLSADVMYDLPDQTLPLWEETLSRVAALPLHHISLYNLTIEPDTAFYRRRHHLAPRLPDDDTSAAMFSLARSYLTAVAGFDHYEISAFAREGRYARHNIGYWTDRPFLGLGPSAFSYWDGARYRNVANLQQYCDALAHDGATVDFTETLPADAHLRERLAVNLRLLAGVDLRTFPALSEDIRDTLRHLASLDLVVYDDPLVKLTERGLLFYDTVATMLI